MIAEASIGGKIGRKRTPIEVVADRYRPGGTSTRTFAHCGGHSSAAQSVPAASISARLSRPEAGVRKAPIGSAAAPVLIGTNQLQRPLQ
jgi:hypothetical protein